MMPLVSVIIPIYNAEKYISECLDSVINQTYKNLEIILVDDGSPDNCGKICDDYAEKDSRIKVIHKSNGGVSSARNEGLKSCTGEWIWFCDPDDWVEKDLISEALNTAMHDETDMCFFDYESFNENATKKHCAVKSNNTVFRNTDETETFLAYFLGNGSVWNIIIRSDIIKDKIYFDETLSHSEDFLVRFQIYGYVKSFSYLHKVLYHYRVRESSAMSSLIKVKDYPEMIINLHKKMIETIASGNYPENAMILVNKIYLEYCMNVLMIAFQDKFSIRCDYNTIKRYIDTDEFRTSIINYDKKNASIALNLACVVLKKPNRFSITSVWFLIKIRSGLKKMLKLL